MLRVHLSLCVTDSAESGTKRFGKYSLPAESGTKRFGKYSLPAEFGTKRFGK